MSSVRLSTIKKYQLFPANNFFPFLHSLYTEKNRKSNLQTSENGSIDPSRWSSCALNCALSALKTDTLHSFRVISIVWKFHSERNRSRERNFLERIARELFKKRDGRGIAFFAFFDVARCRLKKKEFFSPYFLRVPPRKKLVNEEPPSTRFNGVWISDR